MVTINNNQIEILEFDSNKSFKERIASKYNTLVKYLYFEPELDINARDINFTMINILQDWLISDKVSLQELFTNYNNLPEYCKSFLDLKDDILMIWLAYRKANNITLEQKEQIYTILKINDIFESETEFNSSYEKSNFNIKNIDLKIENLKLVTKSRTKILKNITKISDEIKRPIETTNIKIYNSTINFDFWITSEEYKDYTTIELFNKMVVSDLCPFIQYNSYFKILKKFIPKQNWKKIPDENKIYIHLSKTKKIGDYLLVEIKKNENERTWTVNFILDIKNDNILPKDLIIERIMDVFDKSISFSRSVPRERDIQAIYYINKFFIHSYVLSDFILLHKDFSQIVYIDESSKVTKKRSKDNQTWLQIFAKKEYYEQSSVKILNISLPDNIYNVQVRIRGEDMYSVDIFYKFFNRLINIYRTKFTEIISFYREYIEDFGDIERADETMRKSIISGDFNTSGYSRYCTTVKFLKTLTQDEVQKMDDNLYIKFPRDIDNERPGDKYKSDGQNQNFYGCSSNEYKYPGLIKNNLGNRDEFPYLPCCFKTDRTLTKGSYYNNYYHGEPLIDTISNTSKYINSNKFVRFGQYGVLPPNINKIFDVFDGKSQYMRKGTIDNINSSIIASILLSFDVPNDLNSVITTRKAIGKKEDAISICKQSCYDIDLNIIIKNLKDQDAFLDPVYYLQLLEEYFKCKILILRDVLMNKNQTIILQPRYINGYYTFLRKNVPIILLFENFGSESDKAKYPKYELIIRKDKNGKEQHVKFDAEDSIIKQLLIINNMNNTLYSLNVPINPISFPFAEEKIISQWVDNYGKTRILTIVHDDMKIELHTSPLPQFKVPIVEKDSIKHDLVDCLTAKKILKDLGADTIKTTDFGIYSTINFIEFSIKCKLNLEKNFISTFNIEKRLARYITEYMFWIFSKYLHDNNISVITEKILYRFSEEKCIIDENKEYNINSIRRKFSLDSDFMRDEKIVLQNIETLKRLMYVLKLYSIRELQSLLEYRNRESIKEYIVDINDFDTDNNNLIILKGSDALDQYIIEKVEPVIIYDKPIIGESPYFFNNKFFGKKNIYLAQNSNSLKEANKIIETWKIKRYNKGILLENTSKNDIYSFVNSDEISLISGNGEQDNKILGYKINNMARYTCLLSL